MGRNKLSNGFSETNSLQCSEFLGTQQNPAIPIVNIRLDFAAIEIYGSILNHIGIDRFDRHLSYATGK
jgi:hypothetical protein